MLADFGIVGGSPEDRLLLAVAYRRNGFSVHTETHKAKKQRAYKRMGEAVRLSIYDLDDADDREWLESGKPL